MYNIQYTQYTMCRAYLDFGGDRAPAQQRAVPGRECRRRSGIWWEIVLESIAGRQQRPGTGTERQW